MQKLWDALEKIKLVVTDWGDSGVKLIPNIITAIIIMVLFYLLSKFITKKASKILKKRMPSSTIADLLLSFFHLFMMAIGLLTCMGILHLDKTVTTILAGLGVLGLAASFAFQHTSHDLLSGIVLAFKSPIKVGDIIETNGTYGEVKRVGLRATYIDNAQGQLVAVPNRLVMDDSLIAYSVNSERRITITGSIAYESHLKNAEQFIVESVKKVKDIQLDKGVEFYYTEFGDNGVHYLVRFWIPFSNSHAAYLRANSDAYKYIKIALDENNIQIPYPHRVLHIKSEEKENPIKSK